MIVIAPTDPDWIKFLSSRPSITRVNFWTPTAWTVRVLKPGEHFYFLRKGREPRQVVGYGEFERSEVLTLRAAWDKYGEANGVSSLAELTSLVDRTGQSRAGSDPHIGCIILGKTRFFAEGATFTPDSVGLEFARQIVTYKSYDRGPLLNPEPTVLGSTANTQAFEWSNNQLVRSSDDVRASVAEFNSEISQQHLDAVRTRLITTTFWVYDSTTSRFAPSKFAGIRGITHERYAEALSLASQSGRLAGFDGHSSRVAVAAAVGKTFVESQELSGLLRDWATRLLGEDPFGGVDTGKWRFLVLPSAGDRLDTLTASSPNTLEDQLAKLEELETPRDAYVRLEQSILRSFLFGGSDTGKCSICGEMFPVGLLVAGHIKRRADCSEAEKRDMKNVMPVCTFGCDELFERGYLVVIKGRVADGPVAAHTQVVQTRVSYLRGRKCSHWSDLNAPYFEFHRAQRIV